MAADWEYITSPSFGTSEPVRQAMGQAENDRTRLLLQCQSGSKLALVVAFANQTDRTGLSVSFDNDPATVVEFQPAGGPGMPLTLRMALNWSRSSNDQVTERLFKRLAEAGHLTIHGSRFDLRSGRDAIRKVLSNCALLGPARAD